MHLYLDQHPDILMSSLKEPYYFAEDLNIPWKIRNLDDYLSLFYDRDNPVYCGESSPLYMYSKTAASAISRYNPKARILVMLRNPVDFLWSLHGQYLYSGNEDVLDFETALSLSDRRTLGYNVPEHCHDPKILNYYELADFGVQLRRILSQFPREQIHVIKFDDFKENTLKVYSETLGFLGLQAYSPNLLHHNESKATPNLFLRKFLSKIPRIRRCFHLFVPSRIASFVRNSLGRYTQIQRPKAMDEKLRARLQEKLKPNVSELSYLLDMDFGSWTDN